MQYHHQEVIEVVEYVDDEDWEGGSDSEEEVVVEVVEQRIVEPPGVSRSRLDLLRRQSSVMQIAPHEVGIGQQQYELVVESTQTRNHQLPRITTASHTNIYHRYNNSGDDRESEEGEEEEVYVQQLVTIPAPLRRQSSVMQISPHEVGIGQKELIIESTHHPNIPTTNPYGLYNNRANNIEDDDEGEWSESEEEVFVVEQIVTLPAHPFTRQSSVIITPQDVGIGLREYVVESSRNLLQGIEHEGEDNGEENEKEDNTYYYGMMDDHAPQQVGTGVAKEKESPEDRKVREQLEAEIAELDRQIYIERSSRNLLEGIKDDHDDNDDDKEKEDTHRMDEDAPEDTGNGVAAAASNQSYYISSTDDDDDEEEEEEEEEDYRNNDHKQSEEEDQEESPEDRRLREQLEAEIAELERKIEQRKAEKRNSCLVVSSPSPSPPSSPSSPSSASSKEKKQQQQLPLVLNREDSATSVTSKSTNSDGEQPFATMAKKKTSSSFNLGVRASMRMSLVAAKAVKKLRERLVTAQLRNRLRAHTKKKQQQQQKQQQEEDLPKQGNTTTTNTKRVQNATPNNNNDPWQEIIGAIGTAHKSLRPLPKSKRRDSTTWVNKDHPYMRELREVQAEVLPVWRKETYDYWI